MITYLEDVSSPLNVYLANEEDIGTIHKSKSNYQNESIQVLGTLSIELSLGTELMHRG